MESEWENLSDAIFQHARARPDAPAIYQGNARLSYGELAILVGKASVHLHDLGVNRGDLVGMSLPTAANHIILLFAAMRIGAVPVDIPMRRPAAMNPFERFGINRVITVPGVPVPRGVALHTIDADWRRSLEGKRGDYRFAGPLDETIHFSLTSGSTGVPKGVITTQRQWNARFKSAVELFPDVLASERPPHLLVIGEMSFSGFFFFVANQLCIGGPVVLIGISPSPDEFIKAIGEWDDSAFLVTPPMCRGMLAKAPADAALFPRVRAMFAGASPLFADEKRVMAKRLTPNFYEVYGNAATGFLSTLPPAEISERAESVGRTAPGVTLEIVDGNGTPVACGTTGHVRCRGPGISQKFYGPDADASAAGPEGFVGGWYYPGDLAARDAQGYLYLKGRVSDLIRRRGIEIFPPEIEEVLAAHPNVAEVAVVDIPIAGAESEVVAVIVPRGERDFAAVSQHCRAHLPSEKFPSQLFWVEAIPKTGPGKVDKPALRASVINKMKNGVKPSEQERREGSEVS